MLTDAVPLESLLKFVPLNQLYSPLSSLKHTDLAPYTFKGPVSVHQ